MVLDVLDELAAMASDNELYVCEVVALEDGLSNPAAVVVVDCIDGVVEHDQWAIRAEAFRKQLLVGAPTNADEQGLRRLSAQLRAGKVVVKLFLRHNLHAKLYLLCQKHQKKLLMLALILHILGFFLSFFFSG